MAKPQPDYFHKGFIKLCQTLESSAEDLTKSFAGLQSDHERASFVNSIDAIHEIFAVNDIEKDCKDPSVSLALRNSGNNFFKKAQYSEALLLYTESIASAPTFNETQNGKNHLALGYSNRSATLYYSKDYKACLKDIEYSLDAGYPEDLQYKLYDRRGKCYQVLNKFELAKEAFQEAKSKLDLAHLDSLKKEELINIIMKNIDTCTSPKREPVCNEKHDEEKDGNTLPVVSVGAHETFLSLSNACDVKFTEEQGRFLVAKKDIDPGEVILVERPYASVLLPSVYNTNCHHCFKTCYAPVPCTRCQTALYCSTICRENSWKKYHKFECGSLNLIHKSGVGEFGHLALRTIAKSGPKFLQEFNQKGQNDSLSKILNGCDSEGKYREDNFNAIYHLVTHDKDRTSKDLFKRASMALFLCKVLDRSPFFNDVLQNKKEYFEYIAGLILGHLQAFPCNAHEIAEFELDEEEVARSMPKEIGAGIYSTLSLFNHSCHPTVNRNFYGDVCVVRAIKFIRKGEEVSDNYGAVYAVQSYKERQEKLSSQYFFSCQCIACKNLWPLYPDIKSDIPNFKCDGCQVPIGESYKGVCPECGMQLDTSEKDKLLETSQVIFQEGFEKLLAGDVESALPRLYDHMTFLEKHVVLPWRDYNNCQEAIKQCFSIMGNCIKV